MYRFIYVILVFLSSVEFAEAGVEPHQNHLWLSFVPGSFVFIGRSPDNGATYSGTAVITANKQGFRLERTIGTKKMTAKGTIEVASPGEGEVLRFKSDDNKPYLMTCLVHGDLDNYPRLTCLWELGGQIHKTPGLEAYFSTEVWPKDDIKPLKH